MRDIWIHIHIPKCGGISIADLLMKKFESGFISTNSILNDYQYDKTQILKIIKRFIYIAALLIILPVKFGIHTNH